MSIFILKEKSKIPSFVYKKPYLYTITENGIAMCVDEATGEIVWIERIGGQIFCFAAAGRG